MRLRNFAGLANLAQITALAIDIVRAQGAAAEQPNRTLRQSKVIATHEISSRLHPMEEVGGAADDRCVAGLRIRCLLHRAGQYVQPLVAQGRGNVLRYPFVAP
jgi:hypothetical protein